jgi:MoaA/NifB/PqqE/SkfB family radical SAM enzyme
MNSGGRPTMRYDIEADWQLLNTCNYRCDYCFFPGSVLGEKLTVAAEPAAWEQAFAATGATWLLHITGGEPSIYPAFAELCEVLTRQHFISFNSNLSHPSIAAVARRVDPARVSFINAGLHAAERGRRQGLAIFLDHLRALMERGFPVIPSIVATPEVLANAETVADLLRPLGLVPVPKMLRGRFRGHKFPGAYSKGERETFRRMADAARTTFAPVLARMAERPTIDPLRDDTMLAGAPNYRGRACRAGRDFVSLAPNGDVFRCSRRTRLGNLLDGSLVRRAGPTPCDTSYCFYFCEKYAAPGAAAEPPADEADGAVVSGAF